jgi:hypothetical protein
MATVPAILWRESVVDSYTGMGDTLQADKLMLGKRARGKVDRNGPNRLMEDRDLGTITE